MALPPDLLTHLGRQVRVKHYSQSIHGHLVTVQKFDMISRPDYSGTGSYRQGCTAFILIGSPVYFDTVCSLSEEIMRYFTKTNGYWNHL